MNRALLFFLAVATCAGVSRAQESVPAPPAAATPPAAASPAAPAPANDASTLIMAPPPRDGGPAGRLDSDGETRAVSPAVAAALAEGMPKYSPPTPTPTPAPEQDLRDLDKPKNEIKRLPKYEVIEKRPPIFRPRDLYTHAGLVNLSFDNHPGLRFGNILGLNSDAAYQMYLDEQRLADIADLTDEARAMSRGGDKAESSYILQATQDTFMRTDDDWHISGLGTNGGAEGSGK
jgi:hypothetical protein